jgi:pimeloyl-ACP methyl ester carboxylesterase
MILLLILSTFTFSDAGMGTDGYLDMPEGPPRALIIYFHRYVEKGNAVQEWGESLTRQGYAVAGVTARPGGNIVEMNNSALAALRKKPELANVPVIAMGASMGALSASQWFASNATVKGLILIVPGSPDICHYLKSAAGRPVFLIQAENDELSYGSGAKVRTCANAAKHYLLKGAGHLFPPQAVAAEVAQWLNALPLAPL